MPQSETLISLNEYLNTSYSPDCEYVDGRILERNWRERDHDRILHEPPFLCIEILSQEDRAIDMEEKIDDYRNFGVQHVWIVDPKTRKAYVYTASSIHRADDGFLTTQNPDITVSLPELYRSQE